MWILVWACVEYCNGFTAPIKMEFATKKKCEIAADMFSGGFNGTINSKFKWSCTQKKQ